MIKERTKSIGNTKDQLVEERDLVLHNDDYNTFDFVIETLIEVCDHDPVTAEQCTIIVHYKGKCTVKTGALEELKPMSKEMTNRGLTVSIK
jgi:ATP-dependent Clp protease adaptor protein ClpS